MRFKEIIHLNTLNSDAYFVNLATGRILSIIYGLDAVHLFDPFSDCHPTLIKVAERFFNRSNQSK